jgi:hypothetical protein
MRGSSSSGGGETEKQDDVRLGRVTLSHVAPFVVGRSGDGLLIITRVRYNRALLPLPSSTHYRIQALCLFYSSADEAITIAE